MGLTPYYARESAGRAEPKRIQRQRTKGWRMPDGAIYVGRPSKWGNDILPTDLDLNDRPLGLRRSIELYRLTTLRFMEDIFADEDVSPGGIRAEAEAWLAPLRGHDLACWCPLDQPCHADVLLELANR